MRRRPLIGSIVLGLLLEASAAQAHIRLQYPTPRYPAPAVEDGSNLKIAPCGAANDSRTTDATRITTFTPGQQIQVKWAETIGHPGHYRIAFDDNGQDNLIDPASYTDIVNPPVLPILLDGIPDVAGNGTYTETITLPNIVCSNCTLQVIQVMTDKAPYVINTNDVYHQCADIVLAGPLLASGGAAGAGGTTGDAGSSGAGAGDGGAAGTGTAGAGTAGAGTAGAGTAGVGTAGAAGSPSAGSAGLPDQPEPTADMQQLPSGTSGGCALSPRSSGHELALAGLLLGALAAQRRRRQLPGGKLVR